MAMHWIDWAIVVVSVLGLAVFSLSTTRYMRGVADFLSAGRSGGRYMLSISGAMAATGAISLVALFEVYYKVGFPPIWWSFMSIPLGLIMLLSGWVYYRFRETRCLTMAQYFEVRYGRGVRRLAGITIYLSGLVNFGIFPIVGATFFVYFCGFPDQVMIAGLTVPTAAIVMTFCLGVSLIFALMGGQVTVMLTDCAQGIYYLIAITIICMLLLYQFSWTQIAQALEKAPTAIARTEALNKAQGLENEAKDFLAMAKTPEEKVRAETEAERLRRDAAATRAQADDAAYLAEASKGRSLVNPYNTSSVKDFNIWFYLIGIFGAFYGAMSWQGSQGYNSAALTAHEAKMAGVIGSWRGMPQSLMFILLPMVALTFYLHPDFASQAAPVEKYLGGLDNPQIASQVRVSVALSYILPIGIKGLFCVIMLFALITTDDTYLHSWGSIFIQDVVLPFKKQAFSTRGHILALRYSIAFVALFSFIFGLWFRQSQDIVMFFAITGAIVSGVGALIAGGLYWRRATAAGAYAALIIGGVMPLVQIAMKQVSAHLALARTAGRSVSDLTLWIATNGLTKFVLSFNEQVFWFWTMLACLLAFILFSGLHGLIATKGANLRRALRFGGWGVVAGVPLVLIVISLMNLAPKSLGGPYSLLTWALVAAPLSFLIGFSLAAGPNYNLERMLHRGKYAVEQDKVEKDESVRAKLWSYVRIDREFTLTDKILTVAMLVWNGAWFLLFVLVTALSLSTNLITDATWRSFWRWWIWMNVVISIPVCVWFTIGGIWDMRRFFRRMKTMSRDERDDGSVIDHHLPGDAEDSGDNAAAPEG